MEPGLQSYAETDTGYRQFCEQYEYVADDPETRKQYARWHMALMRETGIRETGCIDGRKVGREEGELRRIVQQIHRKKQKSKTREQIIEELELDEESIKILDNFENFSYLLEGQ